MKALRLTHMTDKTIEPSYWSILRLIAPPQAVIHIGAGHGKGEVHQWRYWQVPCALLIEADAAKLDWVNNLLDENPQWYTANIVLADVNAETDYYTVSNPAEDGLIAAEQLQALWPNLTTQAQQKLQVQTLDTLLEAEIYQPLLQAKVTWVIIDCLSSLAILKGAQSALKNWSVISVRVLLNPLEKENSLTTMQAVEEYLEPYGYRCIQITESNNPLVGEVSFVRDWQAVLVSEIDTLTLALEAKEQYNTKILNQFYQSCKDMACVVDERDQQAQLASERQSRIDALSQERDELNIQLQQQEKQINNLKDQYIENEARQQMLNNEMLKAEAQLELIKDVLLREPGL